MEEAEKLGREGAALVRHASFEHVAKVTIDETPAADALYKDLGTHAHSRELKALADDLYESAIGFSLSWTASPTAARRSSPTSNVTG